MSSELILQDLAADKLKLECITAHLGFNSVCVQKWSLRLAADKYRRVKWGCLHDFYGSWHLYICRSLLGHSIFFVASLVFVKDTSCCIITRNFKWNWAARSFYGNILQVIGLHDFRCYLHVAACMEFDTSVVGELSSASCATSGEESSEFSILSEQLTRDTALLSPVLSVWEGKPK